MIYHRAANRFMPFSKRSKKVKKANRFEQLNGMAISSKLVAKYAHSSFYKWV